MMLDRQTDLTLLQDYNICFCDVRPIREGKASKNKCYNLVKS